MLKSCRFHNQSTFAPLGLPPDPTINSIRIKTYILRLYLAVFVLFLLNKYVLRPFVLDHDSPTFLRILVLSIPNTFEAIIGMSNVAGLLMAAKLYSRPRFDGILNLALYLLATVLAGAYVLTQEFKLHDFGGRNAYDPYDVVASIIGIGGMLLVLWRYGILERAGGSEVPPELTPKTWPEWWDPEIELSSHLLGRMEDRRSADVDLRRMLDSATRQKKDSVPGRFGSFARLRRKSWRIMVKPDSRFRVLVVITAYPLDESM